jgi:hypothetical protein
MQRAQLLGVKRDVRAQIKNETEEATHELTLGFVVVLGRQVDRLLDCCELEEAIFSGVHLAVADNPTEVLELFGGVQLTLFGIEPEACVENAL